MSTGMQSAQPPSGASHHPCVHTTTPVPRYLRFENVIHYFLFSNFRLWSNSLCVCTCVRWRTCVCVYLSLNACVCVCVHRCVSFMCRRKSSIQVWSLSVRMQGTTRRKTPGLGTLHADSSGIQSRLIYHFCIRGGD